MRRVLIVLALLVLPLSVMAMTPISDSRLSDVTGQAGVNINVDLSMSVDIGTLAWGDADGITGMSAWGWTTTSSGGFIGVTGLNMTDLVIKSREKDAYNGNSMAKWKPITIDVAQDTNINGGHTFVRFGLGSLYISLNSMTLGVGLSPENLTKTTTPNLTSEVLGTVNLGAMKVYINPESYVDIYATTSQGVCLNMDITIDHFEMGYLSWGDADGLDANLTGTDTSNIWMTKAGTTPGYVGLQDLQVGAITITGLVRIDVNTTSTAGDLYYHYNGDKEVSVVHIGFGSGSTPFEVNVAGPIKANVRTGSTADLNTNGKYKELGNLWIEGFDLKIKPNSWVDIWAH